MRKLTPINVNPNSELSKQLGTQEMTRSTPLSRDPKNYPVFRVPVNKKVLIYVPNHTVQDKDGIDVLRMDTPWIHTIQYKNRWEYIRCIHNLVDDEAGFDGTCPLCEACSESWELANLQIEDKCLSQNLNPDDKENEAVKSIRSAAFSARVINDADQYVTFPIVVFDTVNDDGKTIVKTESGNVSYTIMWYSCKAAAYQENWVSVLENMEDEPTHPGGLFFTLDYTYTPKSGEPNARDSARNLKIFHRVIKNSESIRKALDEATESWDPAAAIKYVIRNSIYSAQDLEEIADEYIEPTRNLIALYNSKKNNTTMGIESNEVFNLEKAATVETPVEMDETDEDAPGEDGLDIM